MSTTTALLLETYLKRLRLPTVAKQYQTLARDAVQQNCTYEEYLCTLLEQEFLAREESRRKLRVKQAGFPILKTLEGFDFTAIPSLDKQKVLTLSRNEYIQAKENIIAIGNAGTGKSHILIALGLCACQQGYRVRFYTASGLVTELLQAQLEHRLSKFEKKWLSYDAVLIDELGYVPYSKEGAELFFRFVATRYERGSIMITSNLEFAEWTQVFGEERLTAALLDRLTHRCHILLMNGESYRFKESMKRQSKERENKTK